MINNLDDKILIIKDPHLKLGFRDNIRKSGWEKDMENKHDFIIEYALKNNIKNIIFTGDVFDKQRQWSFKQFIKNKEIIKKYKESNLELFSIAGNHDMLDGRESFKESPFDELVKENYINHFGILEFNNSIFIGYDYYFIPDTNTKKEFLAKIKNDLKKLNLSKKAFLVLHQNITPNETQFTDFTYTELSEFCKQNNIIGVICGHYHKGYETQYFNDILFINPWNLWRVVRDYETEFDLHKPEMVELIINNKKIQYNHIKIPYKKYNEAFDIKELEIQKELKKETFSFFKKFKSAQDLKDVSETDDKKLLEKIKEELKEKLKDNNDNSELTDEKIEKALKLIQNYLS